MDMLELAPNPVAREFAEFEAYRGTTQFGADVFAIAEQTRTEHTPAAEWPNKSLEARVMSLRSARAALQAAHEIAFYYGEEALASDWVTETDALGRAVHDIWREDPLTDKPTPHESSEFEGLTEAEKDKDRAYGRAASQLLQARLRDGSYQGTPTELVQTWMYLDQDRCNELSRLLNIKQRVDVVLLDGNVAGICLTVTGKSTNYTAPLPTAAAHLRNWSDQLFATHRAKKT